MPDSFATVDQAAAYDFALPADRADGLLARATQAIRDAAGFSVLEDAVTADIVADRGELRLPVPLISSVTSVALLPDRSAVAGWQYIPAPEKIAGDVVRLPYGAPGRHCGTFAVSLVHGLRSAPASLVMLTARVAYRLAATPAPAMAGIRSQSVGSVSWTVAAALPGAQLTPDEECTLRGIVPVRAVWGVGL